MSRALKSMESSGAALAALCIAGVSSHANAATINAFIDSQSYGRTNIAIDASASASQFYYNVYADIYNIGPGCCVFGPKAEFQSISGRGEVATTNDPSVNPSAPYFAGGTQLAKNGVSTGTQYIQLKFLNGTGIDEYAYATFNGEGDLVSITGDISTVILTPAVATPVPAAWALFIGGAGMLGYAAKRRRRRKEAA